MSASSSQLAPDLVGALAAVRLLALDVDGVLTDGSIVYAGAEELQRFYVRDGQALVWLRRAGVEIGWITGRGSLATRTRAEELGVRELFTGVDSKASVLAELQERLGVTVAQTAAMGDDLPDLSLARRAGLFACPRDAAPEVREHAAYVTRASGGRGAVRELVELILRAKGLWEETLERYVRAEE